VKTVGNLIDMWTVTCPFC